MHTVALYNKYNLYGHGRLFLKMEMYTLSAAALYKLYRAGRVAIRTEASHLLFTAAIYNRYKSNGHGRPSVRMDVDITIRVVDSRCTQYRERERDGEWLEMAHSLSAWRPLPIAYGSYIQHV